MRHNNFISRILGKNVPIVRITFCACLILATLSLFTPYPARLVEAFRGSPPQKPVTGGKPLYLADEPGKQEPSGSVNIECPSIVIPVPTVNPVQDPNMVDARTIKPWSIEQSLTMPPVQYPPFPPVIQSKPTTGSLWNVNELGRGLNLKTQVNFKPGGLASADRNIYSNYRATFTMDVTMPRPLTKIEELNQLNPHVDKMLPGIKDLFANAKVSPFYTKLYSRKQNQIRKNIASLNKVLDRHNFYDTETILEMKHPVSNRKVLWLQSEMDVVSDGSDGDRLTTMPDKILNSSFYQPSTSYRWKKLTDQKNPLLPVWETRLKNAKADLAKAKAADRKAINARIDHAQRVITELKNYSFLIAEYDPFIVISLGIVNQSSSYSPSFGDYVVVIVGDKLYPAIVGDAGPNYKTGEASLRMATTINPKAGIYARPVSDLNVSYLIFPGSAEPEKGPPDYQQWEKRAKELLADIGGLGTGYTLHQWEDLLAPKPPQPPSSPEPSNTPSSTTGYSSK